MPKDRFIQWLAIPRGKYFKWVKSYGKEHAHNAKIPRDTWILPGERQAILDFQEQHPLDGYRRLAYMMIDRDIVAVSPATVYRVLKAAGRMDRWPQKASKKGTGFQQPGRAHEHWHIDIAYLNLVGTFYYLCTVLDGFSRAIVHWAIRESMKEADVERIVQRAREKHPGVTPRIISDNGPQFIAGDFKQFIRLTGMTHVRISPYYPQSNGKIERWHKSLKSEAVRPAQPRSLEEAVEVVDRFVRYYNEERLHSALDYVAPVDVMAGRRHDILAERDRKLEAARAARRAQRDTERREAA